MADRMELPWGRDLKRLPRIEHADIKRVCDKTTKKSFHKGYKFFWDSYVHNIEVKEAADAIHLRANCYRSQKKSEKPHKVEMTLNKDQLISIMVSKCSCTAGKGFCQHQVALLFQLGHYQALKITRVPEIVSSTSAPQKWHIPPRTHGFVARPVKDVTFIKPGIPTIHSNDTSCTKSRKECGVKSKLYNPMNMPLNELDLPSKLLPTLEANAATGHSTYWYEPWSSDRKPPLVESNFGLVPNGCLLSYHERPQEVKNSRDDIPAFEFPGLIFNRNYFPLPKNLSTMYFSLQVQHHESLQFEHDTWNQSKCPEWHKLRRYRITASIFKSITGRRGKFDELAKELLKKKPILTEAMAYGISHEEIAAKKFSLLFGVKIYDVGFIINPSVFHLGCSPDRIVCDPQEQPSIGLLEVKCTKKPLCELTYLKSANSGFELRKSHMYFEQCMGQMGLTGYSWCDFFVWSEDEYHRERIYYDDEMFRSMKTKIDDFYFDFFLPVASQGSM